MKNIVRSKAETYNLLKFGLKIYLPIFRYTPFSFMKQLLNLEKTIIYKNNVKIVDVPKWQEFNIDDMYDFAKKDERFKKFLPDWTEYVL